MLPPVFTMLQELVQNAEDAGARCFRLLYDEDTYPADHLYSDKLDRYQVSLHQPIHTIHGAL